MILERPSSPQQLWGHGALTFVYRNESGAATP
jgi:hypothetical protein